MSDELAPPDRRALKRVWSSKREEMAERERLHDVRVEQAADLMRELKYKAEDTTKSLAGLWGIPYHAAVKIASEAAKQIRAEYHDDRILSKVAIALDHVIDRAIASNDYHAVIKACDVWARVTGAGAAVKVAVGPDLSALTPEQLRARRAEVLKQLQSNEAIEVKLLPPGGDDASR